MTDLLKLIAFEASDMQVISALIQDSLVCAGDMNYSRKTRQFSLILRRYVWEGKRKKWWFFSSNKQWRGERRLSILHFNFVKSVKSQNINNKDEILSLLSVETTAREIKFYFANDRTLVLEVENIEAQLTDQGGGWQANMRPKHKI